MMKKVMIRIALMAVIGLALGACSAASAGAPVGVAGAVDVVSGEEAPPAVGEEAPLADTLSELLPSDYPDALSARNQLALGTLRLEETPHAVTPAQARTLAFLWQGFRALSGSSTAAGEELSAVQQEIVVALTAEQLDAIRGMRLTGADLNAFYEERGIPLPTGDPDNPDAEPGAQRGRNMTEEERAAWRAEREAAGGIPGGGGGGGGAGAARRDALIDAVIALLGGRAE